MENQTAKHINLVIKKQKKIKENKKDKSKN